MRHAICVLDDEAFIADSLGKLLRREFADEADVYVTYRAADAAEVIRSKRCDVALADIQMPGMNGLEMLRRLRAENNQVQVVFLTGFDSFEYAYDAIQQEAAGYVLKTEDDEHIVEIIRHVMGRVDRQCELENACTRAKDRLEHMEPIFRGQLLADYFKGNTEHCEVLNPNEALLMVLARDVCNAGITLDDEMALSAVASIMQAAVPNCHVESVHAGRDLLWLISGIESENTQRHIFELLCGAQEAIVKKLERELGFVISAHPVPGCTARAQYEVLRAYLGYQLVTAHGGVAVVQNGWMRENYDEQMHDMLRVLNRQAAYCQQYLEEGFVAQYETALSEVCHFLCSSNTAYLYDMAGLYMQLASQLLSYVRRNQLTEKLPKEKLATLGEVRPGEDWFAKAKLLREVSQLVFHCIESDRFNGLSGMLVKVQHYVESHLDEDLSIGRLAQIFGYSSAHMARLFKQVIGVSLRDYVQNKRIGLAKSLLHTTSLKVYEITRRCGYENTAYFIRVFKAVTGLTPQEYRSGE